MNIKIAKAVFFSIPFHRALFGKIKISGVLFSQVFAEEPFRGRIE